MTKSPKNLSVIIDEQPTADANARALTSAPISLPPLPAEITARIRAAALDVPTPPVEGSVEPAVLTRLLATAARAVAGASAGTAAATREKLATLGKQFAGLRKAPPTWLALPKLTVPQISPEVRDGLLEQGRRAGIGIGTAIDKIIRGSPASDARVVPAIFPVEVLEPDVSTVAIRRSVRQPSILAPGHILTALLAGGIIHIATTFAITTLGTGSAYRQLRAALPVNELVVLPAQTPSTQLLPFLAPDMLYAICRFDLNSGPLEVKAMLPEAGWSLALYTRSGDNFYATPGQGLRPVPVTFVLSPASDRLVNLTPGVRKSDVDVSQVTSPDAEGLMVIRAPLKGVAFEATARTELKAATCARARR